MEDHPELEGGAWEDNYPDQGGKLNTWEITVWPVDGPGFVTTVQARTAESVKKYVRKTWPGCLMSNPIQIGDA